MASGKKVAPKKNGAKKVAPQKCTVVGKKGHAKENALNVRNLLISKFIFMLACAWRHKDVQKHIFFNFVVATKNRVCYFSWGQLFLATHCI